MGWFQKPNPLLTVVMKLIPERTTLQKKAVFSINLTGSINEEATLSPVEEL